MTRIILASRSPRRVQLLRELGIRDFEIIPSQSEEEPDTALSPEAAVEHISMAKAREVLSRAGGEGLIIAADTLVYLDGRPLGKPSDEEDAKAMLRSLSGREHLVVTGLALILDGRELSAAESTLVRFRELSDEDISWYVSTGEPMDKAGAYGAQGLGAIFIKGITGDFFNVMGLPLCRLAESLEELGMPLTSLVSEG